MTRELTAERIKQLRDSNEVDSLDDRIAFELAKLPRAGMCRYIKPDGSLCQSRRNGQSSWCESCQDLVFRFPFRRCRGSIADREWFAGRPSEPGVRRRESTASADSLGYPGLDPGAEASRVDREAGLVNVPT
jgi:hypothetical protein